MFDKLHQARSKRPTNQPADHLSDEMSHQLTDQQASHLPSNQLTE